MRPKGWEPRTAGGVSPGNEACPYPKASFPRLDRPYRQRSGRAEICRAAAAPKPKRRVCPFPLPPAGPAKSYAGSAALMQGKRLPFAHARQDRLSAAAFLCMSVL